MKVEIQRTPSKHRIMVFRDDGVTFELHPPDRKFSPPHDVIHLVVEKTLGLQRGFWGSVANGAKFPSMAVVDGRQQPHADTRSKSLIKINQQSLNVAEVFVGVFQEVLLRNPKAYREDVARRLRERGKKIESEKIERVWSALVTLRDAWEGLAVGESIVLEWSDHDRSKPNRK